MKAAIYHLRDEFFPPAREEQYVNFVSLARYSMVGSVGNNEETVDDFLNAAFDQANSVDHHWSKNKGITTPYDNKRSLSVGDVLHVRDEGYYRVDAIGWSKVEMV